MSRREHTSNALTYGTRFQGISQFYMHIPRSSANPFILVILLECKRVIGKLILMTACGYVLSFDTVYVVWYVYVFNL